MHSGGVLAKIGVVALLLGMALLIGYGLYILLHTIYTYEDVPLIIKIVLPVILGGLCLMTLSVLRDRFRQKDRDKFKEVEF